MRKLFLCVASDSECIQYSKSVCELWIDGYDVQLLLIPDYLAQSVMMTTCQVFEKPYVVLKLFNGIIL